MLIDLITKENIQFIDHLPDWEAAISIAAQPLVDSNTIKPTYIDAIIDNVKTLGPYIVIGPEIALPHARPEAGVNNLGMSFMKLNKPVYFSEDKSKPVTLFFCLAAPDNSSHLQALSQLTKLLCENGNLEKLKACTTAEEVRALLNEYSGIQYQ